jgi:type IV pilus assembly protein PilM
MILSIDMGSHNLHLIEGRAKDRNVEIVRSAVQPMALGTLADGVVKDHAGIELAIKSALAKSTFRSTGTVITFNSTQLLVKELEIPVTGPKETTDMVRFEILQSSSGSKDLVVQHVVSGTGTTPEGAKVSKVHAMALQKELVSDYYQMLKNVKLTPIALDVHQNALVKLFSGGSVNGRPMEGRSVILVDLGATTTSVYIFTNGLLAYSRLLPVGCSEVERYLNMQRSAEGPDHGKSLSDFDLSVDAIRANPELADIVRPFFNMVSDGIQRIIQYHKGRADSFVPDDIFLFGGATAYKGMPQTLGSILNMGVEAIQTMSRIQVPPDIRISDFINACGAMIRLD